MLSAESHGAKFQQEKETRMTASQTKKEESPFVCNMLALNAEQRKRQSALIQNLRKAQTEIRELPDGYSFRFAGETAMIRDLGEFIANERLCCPFFEFTLKVEREGGPLWLNLTGREGVKLFIKTEFGF
ncbi:MAG: hypothetical protein ACRD82_17320 [Blastocatellia bacterium]